MKDKLPVQNNNLLTHFKQSKVAGKANQFLSFGNIYENSFSIGDNPKPSLDIKKK
jgi:hypothetical protein